MHLQLIFAQIEKNYTHERMFGTCKDDELICQEFHKNDCCAWLKDERTAT